MMRMPSIIKDERQLFYTMTRSAVVNCVGHYAKQFGFRDSPDPVAAFVTQTVRFVRWLAPAWLRR